MNLRTVIVAFVLGVLPGLAMAGGDCGWGHERQAMSCADGQVFDAETERCVDQVSS